MKSDTILKIAEVLILVIMLGVIFKIFYAVQIDQKECIESPLTYAARRFDDANEGVKFSCTCSFGVPNSPTLFFDKDNVTQIRDQSSSIYESIDMSFLESIVIKNEA